MAAPILPIPGLRDVKSKEVGAQHTCLPTALVGSPKLTSTAAVPSAPSSTDLTPEQLAQLYTEPSEGVWKPIIPLDELSIDPDQRALVEALANRGLLPQAEAASTCRSFFRKILEFSDHWARVGRTTCHLLSCRNCGRGKMRAHRIYARDAIRYVYMVARPSRTMRLVIEHAEPCADPFAYRLRVHADKRYLVKFRRKVRQKFGREAGILSSIELDPARTNSIFRIYYVGPAMHHPWIREQWQQIVGLRAASESKGHDQDKSPNALRDVLDSLTGILMLPAAERAKWQEAFQGFRLTASWGSLRGNHPEREVEEDAATGDPAAPYGYCPCGCKGIVEKSQYHAPMTIAELSQQYRQLDFGSLNAYFGSSTKVIDPIVRLMDKRAEMFPSEPFPPFQGRWGPS